MNASTISCYALNFKRGVYIQRLIDQFIKKEIKNGDQLKVYLDFRFRNEYRMLLRILTHNEISYCFEYCQKSNIVFHDIVSYNINNLTSNHYFFGLDFRLRDKILIDELPSDIRIHIFNMFSDDGVIASTFPDIHVQMHYWTRPKLSSEYICSVTSLSKCLSTRNQIKIIKSIPYSRLDNLTSNQYEKIHSRGLKRFYGIIIPLMVEYTLTGHIRNVESQIERGNTSTHRELLNLYNQETKQIQDWRKIIQYTHSLKIGDKIFKNIDLQFMNVCFNRLLEFITKFTIEKPDFEVKVRSPPSSPFSVRGQIEDRKSVV